MSTALLLPDPEKIVDLIRARRQEIAALKRLHAAAEAARQAEEARRLCAGEQRQEQNAQEVVA